MFDIGIVEIFLIVVVALFVIGPQQMPDAARKVGQVFRAISHFVSDLKNEFAKAHTFDELENLNQPNKAEMPKEKQDKS